LGGDRGRNERCFGERSQLDEEDAAVEAIQLRVRGVQSKVRLPHPACAGDRQQARAGAEKRRDLPLLVLAAKQGKQRRQVALSRSRLVIPNGRSGGQPGACCRLLQARVLAEDRLLELPQGGARLDSELVEEHTTCFLVGGERVGPSA